MLKNSELKQVMKELNNEIKKELSVDYQIGASYFLEADQDQLNQIDLENLWNYKLEPLLKDYFHGEHEADKKIDNMRKIYFKQNEDNEGSDDSRQ